MHDVDTAGYMQLQVLSSDTCRTQDEEDPSAGILKALQLKCEGLEEQEHELKTAIGLIERILEERRQALVQVSQSKIAIVDQIQDMKNRQGMTSSASLDQGWFGWVGTSKFEVFCLVIIAINVFCLGLETLLHGRHSAFQLLNAIFLVWYVLELGLKIARHRYGLLFGDPSIVWWNWLDVIIVISGIFELLLFSSTNEFHKQVNVPVFRMFRWLRVLKLIHLLLTDVSWAEGPIFESFMFFVICLNSATIAFELDVAWSGWFWFESVILTIYTFELYVRIRHFGLTEFLISGEQIHWNHMDALLVVCALFDQWLVPLYQHLMSYSTERTSSPFLQLARVLRLARILRLVRLLRSIKPLYRIFLGVQETFHSVKWVMILGVLMLYTGGIVFTLLVGRGIIFVGDAPKAATANFGTVPQSMLMLFKLMNDDQSVVDPLMGNWIGKLMFVLFMMMGNWFLLALLTSVVSGDVIRVSQQEEDKETRTAMEKATEEMKQRILCCFWEYDPSGTGKIDADSFSKLLAHPVWGTELELVSGETKKELRDLFQALAVPTLDRRFVLRYKELIERLHNKMEPATERSNLRILNRLNVLEHQLEHMFQGMLQSQIQEGNPLFVGEQRSCEEPVPASPRFDTESSTEDPQANVWKEADQSTSRAMFKRGSQLDKFIGSSSMSLLGMRELPV